MNDLPLGVEHLIVQLGTSPYRLLLFQVGLNVNTGIPIAYPRMTFLETALSSKLNPLVALGRSGAFGLRGFVNHFNGDADLLDDLVPISFRLPFRPELISFERMTIGRLNATWFAFWQSTPGFNS